ncbi:hypothetical protein [Pseudoduganella sp. OTU4001]|uniref:hypothetical protein n=1 Tax=Pseudoduganella sp. OTU4001 TaxID=3043854 RepID=UPI00313BE928
MRAACLLLLAAAAAPGQARAQSPVTLMPEGSREGIVGAAYGEAWERRGSSKRQGFAYPLFYMQWSSGAFIEGLSAGWKLSDEPHFQYGPMLRFSSRAHGEGGSQPTPGGFVQWRVLHDLELVAHTGVGARDGNVKAELALNWINTLDGDHTLVLHAATEKDDARSNRLGARWFWRLGRRHSLMNSVTGIRLAGSAAHAPGVERRSSVAWSTALLYSF